MNKFNNKKVLLIICGGIAAYKALELINEAWKNASEEMYKAQAEKGSADAKNTNSQEDQKTEKSGDDVQDVDFEEVKD